MQSDTTEPASPQVGGDVEAWARLEDDCAAALSLSRQVGALLAARAPAAQVVERLRQTADLSVRLRQQMARLSGLPIPEACAARRLAAIGQVQALLQQEEENRRLLQQQGVRLELARPYQYRPGRT